MTDGPSQEAPRLQAGEVHMLIIIAALFVFVRGLCVIALVDLDCAKTCSSRTNRDLAAERIQFLLRCALVPDFEAIISSGYILDYDLAFIIADRVIRGFDHYHKGFHLRVDVAMDRYDARASKQHRT